MRVTFDDAKLERLFESQVKLRRKYGPQQADKLINRLAQLRAVACTTDLLPPLPGRWHELSSNWAEHWSGDLVHPERLLVRPAEPVPRKDDGGVDWSVVTAMVVVGIHDTH